MAIIRPQVFTTPDSPIVKFREAPEQVNLIEELPKVLRSQGWELGTVFYIQFISHDSTELIKCARFIVSSAKSSIQTFNADSQQPMTKQVEAREAKQLEEWFYPYGRPEDKTIRWNFGAKEYEVKQGDKVITSFKTKEEAENYIKEAA